MTSLIVHQHLWSMRDSHANTDALQMLRIQIAHTCTQKSNRRAGISGFAYEFVNVHTMDVLHPL